VTTIDDCAWSADALRAAASNANTRWGMRTLDTIREIWLSA